MKVVLVLMLIASCNSAPSQNPTTSNIFAGKFQGMYDNSMATVTIKTEDQVISGIFTLDNQSFLLNGKSDGRTFIGEIVDEQSGNFHKVVAKIREGILLLQITFPEHNYQVLELALNRTNEFAAIRNPEGSHAINNNYEPKRRSGDNALIGIWRYTEVLSSGSGEFYASFSTDYFMRINSDGTAVSWIGQSAGGSESISIEGSYGSDIKEFGWYTRGNQFYIVDPSHEEADKSITYYAESNRILLSNGDNKRLFQRVE
ncbi:MAG: hypothetical protein ACOH1O_11345 [Flavobacterium sp.]